MNYYSTSERHAAPIVARREANEEFRRSLSGSDVFFSAGILALGGEAQAVIIDAVRAYDNSDPDDEWDDQVVGDFEVSIEAPGRPKTILVFFRVIIGPDGKASLTLLLTNEWWGCGTVKQDCVRSESHG